MTANPRPKSLVQLATADVKTFKKLVKLKAMHWQYWITLVLIVFSLFYRDIWTAFQTAVCCCFCTIATTKIPVARRTRNETATQTEVPVAEEHCTETRQEENNSGEVETDSYVNINQESQPVTQYPRLKQALGKVFECSYSQFVLLWYDAPEPRERQVLHQALLQEFHTDVDNLIQTTRHLETMTLAVGVVRILTQHLQSSRLNKGKKQSQSRDEELALLRKWSEVLIHNLLPPSLWGLNYMQHLVTEVVSLKVLEPLISMLSDPDHLNQWVVGLFDDDLAQLLAVETEVAEAELNPPQEDERGDEPQEPTVEETENPPEKKKMRSKIADVLNKFKIKKPEKKNKKQSSRKEDADPEPGNLSFRRLGDSHPSLSEADTEDLESDSVISYPETCFVFPYELWKVGHWKIMVSQVWEENEDLSFTIHIEERDDPFQWNVKQTLTAFQQLLSCLKEAPDFSSISDIVESQGEPADDEFLEKARLKLEDFLKELVLNHPAGQSEELFSFLQPPESLLESEEPLMEVWRLVRSVVSFFAPGETEEEFQDRDCSEDTVILDEIDGMDAASSRLGGGDLETDALPIREHLVEEAVPPQAAVAGVTDRGGAGSRGDEVCREDRTHSGDKPNLDQSNIAYRALLIGSADSECNPSDSEDSKMERCIEDSGSKASLPNGIPPCNSADVVDGKRLRGKTEKGKAKLNTRRQETKAEKPEKEVTKAIFELLKEITNNSVLVHCLKFIPSSYLAVKVLSKLHLDEKQVAAHIEYLCEKLWPNGMPAEPSPERTITEKKQTKERAEELLLKILSPYGLLIKAKHVKSVFNTFQDVEANKTLVYMLFLFLCKALVPGDPSLKTQTIPWLNRPL
ncbi:hypothetical protein AOXY_G16482 [Acipenser oxyrinchus oxyrinchus]|uniref:PXA domain-containing protein n=1 Tax=Acipenser oxyrinchus oxyrinchus TaxID=40147 RepID=A0AAD8G4Y0_ACIOX|nr:hypothetical protein AOXY_G16482 [Acipenser oxyrinchus oxyrinchus]